MTAEYAALVVASVVIGMVFGVKVLRIVAPNTVNTWDDRLVQLADDVYDNQVLIALAGWAWHVAESTAAGAGADKPTSTQKLAKFMITCAAEYERLRGMPLSTQAEAFLRQAAAIMSTNAKK